MENKIFKNGMDDCLGSMSHCWDDDDCSKCPIFKKEQPPTTDDDKDCYKQCQFERDGVCTMTEQKDKFDYYMKNSIPLNNNELGARVTYVNGVREIFFTIDLLKSCGYILQEVL